MDMKHHVFCTVILLAVFATMTGCSTPDLVWLAKTGATEQRQWTCYGDSASDCRGSVNRALRRQDEIDEDEADRLRSKSGHRLYLVTTGDLFPEKAEKKGEIRTIKGKQYQLRYRYYIYKFITAREDLLTGEIRHFRTLPETIMLFHRVGPPSGDAPEPPGSESQSPG